MSRAKSKPALERAGPQLMPAGVEVVVPSSGAYSPHAPVFAGGHFAA
jgi:hypothetical protein